MESIYAKGRDNARTPIQWNDEEHGGFTRGTPWLKVNPNFKEINVEEAISNENSIFHHYRKLIQLRKEYPVIVYGSFEMVNENDENIFAYTRQLDNEKLLVVANFTCNEVIYNNSLEINESELIVSNYENSGHIAEKVKLRPYEAIVYRIS
jgi:oligo-1,6-glucosidase/glucan 1,6-alpha-glucosidase